MGDGFSPGEVVIARDEEWLVTQVETTADGPALSVQGLSELVRGQGAVLYRSLEPVIRMDPREVMVRPDGSPRYRRSRLWLEAMLRKTPVPLADDTLTVSRRMLAQPLGYQQQAVTQALNPESLRPRILLADAVGLGKTLEIGMILAELIRRGRGERILVVTPRHVLEQVQHELWCRFAIGFVRLDSQGVARVKQKLPASRNPFTYFRRVIISIDTLKQERFAHDLRRHRWDAVVIDESHNVTNSQTQNSRLARILAPQTDALILASATPHNGSAESFANLIRLLDPTAVSGDGELDLARVRDLVIRRHRHSQEVAGEVGADWAERRDPDNRLIPALPQEEAVIDELVDTWLYPAAASPYSGNNASLFPWTLAKAFLSSPAALGETIIARRDRLGTGPAAAREDEALARLAELNDACLTSSKLEALITLLRGIGQDRAVIFSERVATLHWLADEVRSRLRLPVGAVRVLHGGLADDVQQGIVESFKQTNSEIRVLITGDIASEGVNLHQQCHRLIHFDIPWSLIRIEQRNGRIDRYGQRHRPEITTLVLGSENERFAGDVRVLTALVRREHEAHRALGDAASLMGRYSVAAEEDEVRQVLAGRKSFDDAVAAPGALKGRVDDWLLDFLTEVTDEPAGPALAVGQPRQGLFARDVDFLREALHEYYPSPEAPPRGRDQGGVNWREYPAEHLVEFTPPPDLRQRLEVLPQGYLAERRVLERLRLVTDAGVARSVLQAALSDASDSSWPEAHFLGPLHPVLDWAADRALARLPRHEIFAVRGTVDAPVVLLNGTLVNRRGQVVTSAWLAARFDGHEPRVEPYESAQQLFEAVDLLADRVNPGPVSLPGRSLVAPAVDAASTFLKHVMRTGRDSAEARVASWVERAEAWQRDASALIQRDEVRQRRALVAEAEKLSRDMSPDRSLVRPLLVVLPEEVG